jgi:hypothetical protein
VVLGWKCRFGKVPFTLFCLLFLDGRLVCGMQFLLGICSCISAGCLLRYLFCSFVGANTFRAELMAPLLKDTDCYLDVHIIEDVDVGRFSSENCQFSYFVLMEVPG